MEIFQKYGKKKGGFALNYRGSLEGTWNYATYFKDRVRWFRREM